MERGRARRAGGLGRVLEGYEATLDWPACSFYEELMERHPEAKVLLSVRDPERWHESTRSTIYELTMLLDSSRTVRLIFGLISLLAYGGFAGFKSTLPHDVIWGAPSTDASRTRPTPSRSSSGTTRRSNAASRPSGYWSTRCKRVGDRYASSSAYPSRKSPSRAATTQPRCGSE